MKILLSLIRSHHILSPAILIFVSSAVYILTLILMQPVPLQYNNKCKIYHMRTADHITYALITLHWLRVPQRIDYKVAVMTYKVVRETAPRYLGPPSLVAGHCALSVPVVFWCDQSDCQLLVAGPSMSLVPVFGTCCRRRSRQHSLCRCSVSVSRHSSSRNHILMSFYEAETLSSVDFSTATFYIFVLVFLLHLYST